MKVTGGQARAMIALSCCVLASTLTMSGCASGRLQVIDAPAGPLRSIYVVRRGWHTGIAVAARDWPDRNWSLLADFRESDFLEFGWGDERFYEAERKTAWMTSRAALWPTPSVIHVIGLREPIRESAHAREIVEVPVATERLRELASAIAHEFAGDDPIPTGASLSAAPDPNRFYEANRSFYFPRMCNWWAARLLQEAGCPVVPGTVIFASRVIDEARECAAMSLAAVPRLHAQ